MSEPEPAFEWPSFGCEKCGNQDPNKISFLTKFVYREHYEGGGYNVIAGSMCEKCGHRWKD